jgi:hypothetical protein
MSPAGEGLPSRRQALCHLLDRASNGVVVRAIVTHLRLRRVFEDFAAVRGSWAGSEPVYEPFTVSSLTMASRGQSHLNAARSNCRKLAAGQDDASQGMVNQPSHAPSPMPE